MAKEDVKDFVCKPYCSFFREGVKEELICNGARLLEILLAKRMLSPGDIEKVNSTPAQEYERNCSLEKGVCGKCPFRQDDCDFQSECPPPDARPCGGYILLALLSAEGFVAIEKLQELGDG